MDEIGYLAECLIANKVSHDDIKRVSTHLFGLSNPHSFNPNTKCERTIKKLLVYLTRCLLAKSPLLGEFFKSKGAQFSNDIDRKRFQYSGLRWFTAILPLSDSSESDMELSSGPQAWPILALLSL